MIAIDSPFLDRLLFTLFKYDLIVKLKKFSSHRCSLIDILQDQEIDLFIRDTIRNGEVVERIYKSLTIAYVLKYVTN